MTLDGTPAQSVIDQLKQSFPSASRGSGQVVFNKTDGTPFTASEKAAIAAALEATTKIANVDGVMNPFEAQAIKDQKIAELADAQTKLDKAPADLAAGQKKIDDGWAAIRAAETKLAAGQKEVTANIRTVDSTRQGLVTNEAQLNAAIAQAISGGAPAQQITALQGQLAQVRAGIAQLDASAAQIASAQSQITSGLREVATNKTKLTDAQTALDKARADLPAQTEKLKWGEALLGAATKYRAVSTDGQTALGAVYFTTPLSEVSPETKTAVVDALSGLKLPGVQVEFSKELATSLGTLVGPGEIAGLSIAALVLFIMLGTLIAAGLPVLTALLGVGVSAMAAFGLSSVVDMNSTTPTLGVMLGLAVGIDYSLFILNRHRRQLKTGMAVDKSIALANGTSGSAVLFAGITVIIALLALNLTGIGFLGMMGTVGAFAILVAVLAALTFTPALMRLSGLKVLSRRERRRRDDLLAGNVPEVSDKVKAKRDREVWAAKHPVLAMLVTVVALVIIALPLGAMRLGLPDGSSEPVESTQYRAYSLTSEGFGAGTNGQITAAVSFKDALTEDGALKAKAEIATRLMDVKNVEAVVAGNASADNKTLVFSVVPLEGPASVSTEQVVNDVRATSAEIATQTGGTLGVTGAAAINIDISKKLAGALPLYLATVLGLSILLMILVFRSIWMPIIASAGFLLSVLSAMGAVTAVFQWGWLGSVFGVHDPGPIMNFLPTILIGVLFGLAMDYQLFIATGIREAYAHGESARAAISHGVRAGRSVVIAAAIIMVAVFGSFAFAESATIRPMGFGLAVGVLIDAFLVRLLLVPAALRLLGNKAWWLPRWLDKFMPDVDVEGAKLERDQAKNEVVLVA
jgi:RND superfamily putative drug exporter